MVCSSGKPKESKAADGPQSTIAHPEYRIAMSARSRSHMNATKAEARRRNTARMTVSELRSRSNARDLTIDRIAQFFVDAFPTMTPTEQSLSLALYRKLAEGKPVAPARLARLAALDLETVQQLLSRWPGLFVDDHGCVIGYWGLTVTPTRHGFEVGDRKLYTWCAWDALFIPELLDRIAVVTSTCATSGQPIDLVVSPDRIESVNPDETVVSFLLPDRSAIEHDVTTSLCQFVYFFRSRMDGDRWGFKHADTFLLSVNEAFAIGHHMNGARYPGTLNRKGPAT